MAKKKKPKPDLTPRQRRFVKEFLIDSNATQAAIRAGYSKKTAGEQASRLLANVKISAEVEKGRAKIEEKLECTADDIARELAKLGFSNMADFTKVNENGEPFFDFRGLNRDQMAAVHELTVDQYTVGGEEDGLPVRRVKFKLSDKRASLVDLAKLLGYFKERVEHSGGITLDDLRDFRQRYQSENTEE